MVPWPSNFATSLDQQHTTIHTTTVERFSSALAKWHKGETPMKLKESRPEYKKIEDNVQWCNQVHCEINKQKAEGFW